MSSPLLSPPAQGAGRPEEAAERARRHAVYAAALLGIAVALGAVVRLVQIGSQSLWGDEAYTVAIAQRGFGGMWELFAKESNGFLYYLLEYPVARLDPAVDALRLPSAIFGLLAIVAVYWAGNEILDRRAAVVGALALAVSPIAVEYSQQARFYALTVLLACVSFACLARAIRRGDTQWWVLYVLATAAASYTSTLGAFLLALPQLCYAVGRGRRALRSTALAMLVVVVVLIPLIVLSLIVLNDRNLGYFLSEPGLRELPEMVRTMFGGSGIVAVTVVAACAAGVIAWWRGWRPAAATVARHPATAVLAWAVLPIVAGFAISWAVEPVFVARLLIVALPGACLLIGFALSRLPIWAAAACVLAVIALSLVQLGDFRSSQAYGDFRDAIGELSQQRAAGEPVLFDTAPGLTVAGHYDPAFAGPDGRLYVPEYHDAQLPPDTLAYDDEGGYHETATGPPSAETVAELASASPTGRVWIVFNGVGPSQGDYLDTAGMGWARDHCAVDVTPYDGIEVVSIRDCSTA